MSIMHADNAKNRRFLMLQGPHGPFFYRLGQALRAQGAQVWRVGFNLGDRAFWLFARGYIPFRQPIAAWDGFLSNILAQHEITDLVLYGDPRPIHAQAISLAKARGITVHILEEGYLRPYWVTYERGGANGFSDLMGIDIDDMRRHLHGKAPSSKEAPAIWGDLRQHMFWGALYHWFVLVGRWVYPAFRPHRSLTVWQEFLLYCRRFLSSPYHMVERFLTERKIMRGGFPYHLVLLQLEHDASFRTHSPFSSQTDFISVVIDGFVRGAPQDLHLVFKAHPLEDGRAPIAAEISRLTKQYGIEDKVHFVRGGKLAQLLSKARAALTVNSTAGQQVLWRGLPLRIFGTAIYDKNGLVSHQNVDDFFAQPTKPDLQAYADFRQFLLTTCQVRGGFYSRKGRKLSVPKIARLMLSSRGPYDYVA